MKQTKTDRSAALIAIILLFAWLSGPAALAQATNTGTVVGQVTDQSGAAVPTATITLTDDQTKSVRTTVTNGTGEYVFTNVPPGTYNLAAGSTGFEMTKVSGQPVSVGTQATVNFRLHIGNAQETVQVTAEGNELQTMNATVGSVIPPDAIEALPSLLHDAGTFTELQPGVSPDGSVAGVAVDQSTFSLDGGNNSNDMDGSMSVYTPSFAGDPTGGSGGQSDYGDLAPGPTGVMPTPQDSVEEFKVNTANQGAEFNNSAGAEIEVVTKRGTDTWHGTAYEYYMDNNFSGNTWGNNLTGTPVPSFHYNKFGVAAGGPILPTLLGSKTYFFANYQGWRFPQSQTYERAVPSANMEKGIVTFNGVTYDLKALDPRGIGIDPTVQQLWTKYEPAGNDTSCGSLLGSRCDGVNEIGYKANLALPEDDNFFVARMDHDFSDKWHWMTSYRYYKLTRTTDNQVDIGGYFAGDTLGTPTAVSSRPQQPWYLVSGLTTSITSRLTNDFHFSYLRNFWQWTDNNAPPQFSGLGGVLEPFGETATGVLAPFNVDTQDIRTRFWDGHDSFFRDDLTLLKGKHLLQFGGQFQHNWDYHQRTDNGGGINFTPTYQLGDSAGAGLIDLSSLATYPTSTTAARVAAAVYGMVTDSQIAYTRQGANLALNPPLTPAFDKSTIDFYNVYFSDTWRLKPSFTFTYGLGWTLEMPPTEATGKQVDLVDDSDQPISATSYLARRKAAASQGNVYNPEIGFALVGNVGGGMKYPYNPFYGSFSPRVAAAWNPHFDADSKLGHIFGRDGTVIRGGYGRFYGRLNGVDLVLSPLLGVGLIQAVQCRQALSSGVCGPANPTASTAFRIGIDGNSAPLASASATLPQPDFPGFNDIAGSASEAMDPDFRPNRVDSFDLTIQRQVSHSTLIEVGYIGRIIRNEYMPLNINAVPYMMTAGGQEFQTAYAALETAIGCAKSAGACGASGIPTTIAPQPFFESALAGTGYCLGYASCTAAVLNNEFSNLTSQAVWSIWSDLDNGGFNFPRTMMNTPIAGQANGGSGQMTSGVAINTSTGYGNYNGGFFTVKTNNFHGMTIQQNFTYSKALGTGSVVQASSEITANDPFDLSKMYGLQAFNRKFVYNTFIVWHEPWFKSQHGIAGRFVGGWELAPVFTAGSGGPLYCGTPTEAQSFGAGDGANYFENEECVFTSKYTGGHSGHYDINGGTDPYGIQVGTATAGPGSAAVNMFKDPVAVWNQVRAPILGIDEKDSGLGPISGLPYWNMDLSVQKVFQITERTSFEYSMIFANVFNHNVMADPALNIASPSSWGVMSSQVNTPRNMEFGLRVRF